MPDRSGSNLDQIQVDNQVDRSQSPEILKKTAYSWISEKNNNQLDVSSKPIQIKDKKTRKKEVARLENALQRLLINLGSDVDPNRRQQQIEEEESSSEPEEKPEKKHAEDNKLANTMTSQVPAVESQESLDQEREMDSYVATLRDGYLGIGSGLASPIEMEI